MGSYGFYGQHYHYKPPILPDFKTETNKYKIKKCRSDGNCFFRAISDQIYGNQDEHIRLRTEACDYLCANKTQFSEFVTGDYTSFVTKMRTANEWADHVAMLALAQSRKKNILILEYSKKEKEYHDYNKIEIDKDFGDFLVSYHNGRHYNSAHRNESYVPDRVDGSVDSCQCVLQ